MGVDLFICTEQRYKGKWVMLERLHKDLVTVRNYDRYNKLRGYEEGNIPPRGLPADISESAQLFFDEHDDAFHHGWLTVEEAAPIFLSTEWKDRDNYSRIAEFPIANYFNISPYAKLDNPQDYRIIFGFAN